MLTRTAGALLTALTFALLAGAPAKATFPGENGKIAFTGCGATDCGVFVVNPDGSGRTQVTHNPFEELICVPHSPCGVVRGQDNAPHWSADGKKLVFERQGDIYTSAADGSGLQQLTATSTKTEGDPAWSPDGTRIVFTRHESLPGAFTTLSDLLVMNADGTGAVQIGEWSEAPDWSPDGSTIAYPYRHHNEFGYYQHWQDLRLISPDGTNDRAIAATEEGQGALYSYEEPSWSPDGLRIAVKRAAKDSPCCNFDFDIGVMNADGTGFSNLTNASDADDRSPAFSPDGTKIAFDRRDGGVDRIWLMNPDGTGKAAIADGTQADWQPVVEPQRGDYKNGAHFCKAQRELLGAAAFRQRYGGGANAFGRCVKAHN